MTIAEDVQRIQDGTFFTPFDPGNTPTRPLQHGQTYIVSPSDVKFRQMGQYEEEAFLRVFLPYLSKPEEWCEFERAIFWSYTLKHLLEHYLERHTPEDALRVAFWEFDMVRVGMSDLHKKGHFCIDGQDHWFWLSPELATYLAQPNTMLDSLGVLMPR